MHFLKRKMQIRVPAHESSGTVLPWERTAKAQPKMPISAALREQLATHLTDAVNAAVRADAREPLVHIAHHLLAVAATARPKASDSSASGVEPESRVALLQAQVELLTADNQRLKHGVAADPPTVEAQLGLKALIPLSTVIAFFFVFSSFFSSVCASV